MNSVIVALNLVSFLYVLVMIVGCFQVPKEAKKRTRHFRYCLWVVLLGLVTETVAAAFEGDADKTALLVVSSFIPILLLDFITYFYSLYIRSLVEDKKKNYMVFTSLLMGLSVFDFILVVISFATGNLFSIEDGIFVKGSFFAFRGAIPAIILFGIFLFFVTNYKVVGIRSFWLTILFMLIPTGATVVTDLFAKTRFQYAATAVSLFVVYVVLQSKVIIETDVKSQILNQKSISDSLTGLKNRRGYQQIIDSLKDDDRISVVFCDANGLKAVNDNEGHQAGDEFIKRIANLLRNSFSDGEVCRISGDEFVSIIIKPDEDKFDERMKDFGELILREGRIVSYGYEKGDGKDFLELVKTAEKKMYSDKEKYYKETGKDRRK